MMTHVFENRCNHRCYIYRYRIEIEIYSLSLHTIYPLNHPIMKSINATFPVIEHLRESFSSDCVSACGDPSADPSLREACDLGSQSYCKSDKISSTECNDYLARVFNTKAGVTIPLPIAAGTINTYYAELKAHVIKIATDINDVATLRSAKMNNLLEALRKESSKEMYYEIVNSVIKKWRLKSETEWTTLPWIIERINAWIAGDLDVIKDRTAVQILEHIGDRMDLFTNFMPAWSGVIDTLLTKDLTTVYSNTTLLKMREVSSSFELAFDLYVYNTFGYTKITTLALTSDKLQYNYAIKDNKEIYSASIRQLYSALKSRPARLDKLKILFEKADAENITRIKTVNPSTDALCIAMKATGEPELVKAINDEIAVRCTIPANISAPDCVSSINAMNPIPDSTYKIILQGSIKSDGTLDKTILDKYPGMKEWLVKNTADTVTIDANGNALISSTCSPNTNLTATQCNQLCKIYPETCNADQIKRCSVPGYRYRSTFANKEGLELEPKTEVDNTWWILFILTILVFVCFISGKRVLKSDKHFINLSDDGASF